MAGYAGDHDAIITQLCLSAAASYTSQSDNQAVRKVLEVSLNVGKFLKTFTPALLRTAASKRPPQEAFTLFSWNCLVVCKLNLAEARKAIIKVLESQVWLVGKGECTTSCLGSSHQFDILESLAPGRSMIIPVFFFKRTLYGPFFPCASVHSHYAAATAPKCMASLSSICDEAAFHCILTP